MKNQNHHGFKLLELLVVMVIIDLSADCVGPRYFAQVGESEVKFAKAQIDAPEKGQDQYRLDTRRYPRHFPALYTGMVRAGERAGDLVYGET